MSARPRRFARRSRSRSASQLPLAARRRFRPAGPRTSRARGSLQAGSGVHERGIIAAGVTAAPRLIVAAKAGPEMSRVARVAHDAAGGTRTHKPLRAMDFESISFASLDTAADPPFCRLGQPPCGPRRPRRPARRIGRQDPTAGALASNPRCAGATRSPTRARRGSGRASGSTSVAARRGGALQHRAHGSRAGDPALRRRRARRPVGFAGGWSPGDGPSGARARR